MPPTHTIHPLFRSARVKIVDYRCSGEDSGAPEEEWPATYQIALPRRGVYLHRDARGTVVADPTQALFFNPNQPYEVTHPLPGGDASTVFILSDSVAREMLAANDPASADAQSPAFVQSHLAAETPLRLWQFWLVQAHLDALAVEEAALILLGQVVAESWLPAGKSEFPERRSALTRRAHADLAQDAVLYLNARATGPLTLEDIAGAVHSSVYHLCRVFQREIGCTMHHYLQRLRLLQALERLAEAPGEPLARIAVDCGFASHSHLSTVFRQTFGVSPSHFRRAAGDRQLRKMRKMLKV